MKGKRLLLFSDEFAPFPGGIARYATEVAQAASDLGMRVTVVAPLYRHLDGSLHSDPKSYKVYRISRSEVPSIRMLQSIMAIIWFRIRIKPEVTHATDLQYGFLLQLVAPIIRLRYTVTVHGTDILTMKDALSVRLAAGGNPLKGASAILCNSNFTRSLVAKFFPSIVSTRIRVTHLGVAQRWFDKATDQQQSAVRKRYGINHDAQIVLTVARVEPRKGQITVIEAINRLNVEGYSSLVYVIVGKTDESAYTREVKAAAAKAKASVLVLGVMPESDLQVLYASSFAFCMPGLPTPDRIEGFGLAYLEAAATGLPSIATRLGGAPEAVSHGYTGILLDDPSVSNVAEALRGLLMDKSAYEMMRINARRWAENFTWANCVKKSYGEMRQSCSTRTGQNQS